MKKIGFTCVLIIIFLMLCGCSNVSYKKDIATMTQEEKMEDFNYIINTMDLLYPFWGELADKGIDKEALQKEYKDKVIQSKDTIGFLNIITHYFNELGNHYGHLAYLAPSKYKYFADVYKDKKPWSSVLSNSRAKAMYGVMNPYVGYFELSSKTDIATVSKEPPQTEDNKLLMKTVNEGKNMYIRCPSFGPPLQKSEPDKIINFIGKNRDCEYLIIDIRGNGGGSDTYWQEAFVAPNIIHDVTYSMYYLYKNNTLNNRESQKYIKGKSLLKKNNTIADLPHFENLSLYARNFDCFHPSSNTIKSENKEQLYNGKIYVLMDRDNTSATSDFTGFCKENKFAVLVGEATGGDQCFGDPSLFVLPNSGFEFRFDLFYGLNFDGSCNAVTGVQPDIKCNSVDALDVCLKEINKK